MSQQENKCDECGREYRLLEIPLAGKKILVPACSCIGNKYEDEQRHKTIDRYLAESGIPEKYQNEDMTDWQKIEGTEELIEALREYVLNLRKNIKEGRGMFVSGKKGTGKTKIQCYLGNQIIRKLVKRVYYISLARYVADIEETKKGRGSVETYMQKYINAPVLILDDVGESVIDEWNRKYLFLLLDGRNNRKCVTLANTMKHVQENNKYIGSHNVSRLLEMAGANIVEIKSSVDMRYYQNKQAVNNENNN